MIEMLLTAFVLAVGVLGLSLLQVMALRAARGSRSSSTAILLAERVMDQVEAEGRLSWLHLTDSDVAAPTVADLVGLRYITLAAAAARQDLFTVKGGVVDANALDPADSTPFYTATTRRVVVQAGTPTGQLSEFTVVIAYLDDTDQTKAPIQRTVTLVRRVAHG
jgi:Tfp pilus assembly protein PilV